MTSELTIQLDSEIRQALDVIADDRDMTPEEVARQGIYDKIAEGRHR